jgi:hypothetical protein
MKIFENQLIASVHTETLPMMSGTTTTAKTLYLHEHYNWKQSRLGYLLKIFKNWPMGPGLTSGPSGILYHFDH